ncbi:hypothetical protein [Bradyrhizobium murdochi]|uniref:hypothetical protein n=1 Tax=Bradyrhizobium murdochi TaxID=1038859 RepID=UPI0004170C86|nr:hypothetical protein [Bradyrhizobium murdochi]
MSKTNGERESLFSKQTIETVMHRCLEAVMDRYPRLTADGFMNLKDATFADRREDLKGQADGFWAAHAWLSQFDRMKSLSVEGGSKSYGLKEYPERKYQVYISNGAFIAAALNLGFPIQEKGLNAFIGIKRTPKFRSALLHG